MGRSPIAEARFQSRLSKDELAVYLRKHPSLRPKEPSTTELPPPPPNSVMNEISGPNKGPKELTRRPHAFRTEARATVMFR